MSRPRKTGRTRTRPTSQPARPTHGARAHTPRRCLAGRAFFGLAISWWALSTRVARWLAGRMRDDDEMVPQDVLGRRARLLVFFLADMVGYVALLLQLTPPGFPQLSVAAFVARLDFVELREAFWFWPLAVSAALLPLLCGCVLGVLLQVRKALWLYSAGTVACIACRLYLTFEMSRHERAVATQSLLIEMIVVTMFTFVQLCACEQAATLAVTLKHNSVAHRMPPPRRVARRTAAGSAGYGRGDDRGSGRMVSATHATRRAERGAGGHGPRTRVVMADLAQRA